MEWLGLNIGWIIQTFAFVGAIVLTLGGVREKLYTLDRKVDKLEVAVVQIARQDERLLAMDQRMIAQGKRIDRIEEKRSSTRRQEQAEDE